MKKVVETNELVLRRGEVYGFRTAFTGLDRNNTRVAEGLLDVKGNKKWQKFVTKNTKALNAFINISAKQINDQAPDRSDDFKAYAKAEQEAIRALADKDEEGNPIEDQNEVMGYKIDPSKTDAVNEALTKVNEAFPEQSEKMKKYEEWYKEFMQSEVHLCKEIGLFTIDEDDVPESLSARQRLVFDHLIVD